jgi:GNAT superfamily N-acetyltransferase
MWVLRPARPDETTILTELALRSKAYWGYDAAFMDACHDALTFSVADAAQTTVAEVAGRVIGLCTLVLDSDPPELRDMFVAPQAIGRGVGRLLWRDAVERARRAGCRWFKIESDPNAQGFYERMGAVQVGTVLSTCIEGRTLPLMRYDLTTE